MHKKLLSFILFFGITTMNYAENFYIKHRYTVTTHILSHHMSSSSSSTAISDNNDIITENMIGDLTLIEANDFGIFKVPLTLEMKKTMLEINKLLRVPYIKKSLITNNPQRDFGYQLDRNQPEIMESQLIEGLPRNENINVNSFHSSQERSKAQNTIKINDFIMHLSILGHSNLKVKLADFYGMTKVSPKKNGVEVILTLKNIGPFDITFSNPSRWGNIVNLDDEYNENKIWYEVRLGAQCQEKSCWTRFGLLPEYLIHEDFKPEELASDYFTITSNSERVFRYLIPYKQLTTIFNNGEIDSNRTKDGYIHFDQGLAININFWNMYVNFGGVFSKKVWKEEKSSQVKGWVNLE